MSLFRWPLALSPWRRPSAAAERVAPPRPRLVTPAAAPAAAELPQEAAAPSLEINDMTSPFLAWLLSQPKPEPTEPTPSLDTAAQSGQAALYAQALAVLARVDEVIASDL